MNLYQFSTKLISITTALLCHPHVLRILLFGFWSICFVLGCLSESVSAIWTLVLLSLTGVYQILRQLTFLIGGKIFLRNQRASNLTLKTLPSNSVLPLVTVLVPAYNEEEVIESTLASLLELEYPHLEILVIDDGSQDKTVERVKEFAQLNDGFIAVIQKVNSGKASSLNRGLEQARGEFVLCVDADSKIESNGLNIAVQRMLAHPNIAALAGVVQIDTHESLLISQQQLEYSIGNFQKAFLAIFGKTNVVPGPIGLFRREVLLKTGGYTEGKGSYAEDTELTLRLIGELHEVSFEPSMVTHTQAPRDWQNLMKQRYRWTRGTYQAVFQILPSLLSSPLRSNKFFGVFLFSEQIFTVALEFGVLIYCLTRVFLYGELSFFSAYLFALLVCDLLVVSFALQGEKAILKAVPSMLVCRFSYSVMLLLWKVFSILEEWRSVGMNWDKVSRYNSPAKALVAKRRSLHA